MAVAETMEIALVLDERAAVALERIAVAVEVLAANMSLVPTEPPAPVCAHPISKREVMPGSTMTSVSYRCTVCDAEGLA